MSDAGAARRLLAGAAAAVLLPVAGVAAFVLGERDGQDPQLGLQQLDLLYLDEPAPGLAATGAPAGRAVVLLFCDGCARPDLTGADVVPVRDPGLARAYGLGAPGRSGYALVDARGHVRYRTYDPHPGDHSDELQTLVDGLPG